MSILTRRYEPPPARERIRWTKRRDIEFARKKKGPLEKGSAIVYFSIVYFP